MKTKTKLFILIVLIGLGLGMALWAGSIMRNYEGYLEVLKEARQEAMPQIIAGLVFLSIGYVVTYFKSK